jgi:pSer/pThr/pTyr-binding forkhead associated (FHA) protein
MTDVHPSAGQASGQLLLEVVAGKATGFGITVDQRLVIGRQSQGPGCLADDLELSRHHAEILCESTGEYTIKDLASTNGTFVNGERLNAPTVLRTGDAIEVGGTTLVVRAAPEVPPPVVTPPVDVRAATVTVVVPPAMREPEPEAIVASAPEAIAEPEPEPIAEPEPEPIAEPEPEPEPEAIVAGEPEPEAIVAGEPEPEAIVAGEPEPEAIVAGEPEPEAIVGSEPEPEVIVESEPEAPPASEPEVPALPLLELRLVLDVERGEAQIALEDGGEVVRVRLHEGRWQLSDTAT